MSADAKTPVFDPEAVPGKLGADLGGVFDEAEIRRLVDTLYPIPRSILGEGFRRSLDIIGEHIPFEHQDIPSGEDVFDWTVPDEWNPEDAYIITPSGEKIADFKQHNLHLVNYSVPFEGEMDLEALKAHLRTLPDRPDALPYVCSYYKRGWGFCVSQKTYDSLQPGTYKVVIKSRITPGFLRYGEAVIEGRSKQEILLSGYLCHPQMANHELSGPILMTLLYRLLAASGPHRFTYRFVICPENIGAAAFLSRRGAALKQNMAAGYVVNCVAHGEHFTYKRSRRGASLADRAALHVLRARPEKLEVVDYFPDGSDERQYCSPGFNLPVGLIMRAMYKRFPEYHTSDDNKEFFDCKALFGALEAYWRTLLTIEQNFTPLARVQHGTPQLSKSSVPLYSPVMDFRIQPKGERTRVMLEILNQADGTKDMLQIAEEKNFQLLDHADLIRDLWAAGYIEQAA